jgi:indolepyruvate ferredoxin oxidoreductase
MTPSHGAQTDLPQADATARSPALLSGVEAIVRIPLEQHRMDAAVGLRVAAVVSGYPGSPLGTVDLALERQRSELDANDVRHVPGVNEELAATVVWGSQQRSLMAGAEVDGVIGMWYGKSPGVDRCGDVFKHANSMGSAENGGVLVVAGDDPSAKSSTLPNDSVASFFSASIPVLAPSTVGDVLRLGLHGIALSRYSGLWVGLKVVTNLADGFATVVLEDLVPSPVVPRLTIDGAIYQHVQLPTVNNTVSVRQEEEILNRRLEAAKAYSLANDLNAVTHPARDAWLGIAAVGKSHADVVQALADIGLDANAIERAGVRIMRINMPFPLEPTAIRGFADGLEQILVVEEKRPFVETLMRDVLYDHDHRPTVVGKRDERGAILIPGEGELTPERIAAILRARLSPRVSGVEEEDEPSDAVGAQATLLRLPIVPQTPTTTQAGPARLPAFCSGCPHNRSTAGVAGSLTGGGVGCHAMVYLEERHRDDTLLPLTPMGAEGVMWIGAHSFASADHVFQNLGDGTLAHSGSLAVRACVAADVNITFKILYNKAVAMTGGQAVAGSTPVPALTRELEAMGVRQIIVVAEEPHSYGDDARWAPGVTVWHRDRLGDAEQELADAPGVTALIYDQRCAAESRRLRKRGDLARPTKRAAINEAVCEGCGDCQIKSNCLSVLPVETPLGRKTRIQQSTCNQDLTCLDGDCPSFVVVDVSSIRPRDRSTLAPPTTFPDPPPPTSDDSLDAYMVGVGGTGVVTANRLIATAAMLEGWSVSGLDQTGLSQKGGAVVSHLRARKGDMARTNTVGLGTTDVYFAFDALAGSEPKHLDRMSKDRTVALVSTDVAPTISVITQPLTNMPTGSALEDIIAAAAHVTAGYDAEELCQALLGDTLPSHILMIGAAYQHGALPIAAEAFEEAIAGGRGADTNLAAFRWGRALVAQPELVEEAMRRERPRSSSDRVPSARATSTGTSLLGATTLPDTVRELVDWRVKDLVDYQNAGVAQTYLALVTEVAAAEHRAVPGRTELSEAVARYAYKLMAYKDEYEVARLHLDPAFQEQLAGEFPGGRVAVKLHPPALRALGMKKKLSIPAPVSRPLFRGLVAARRLRGTALDPFGLAKVRRVERRLVTEYAAEVRALLPRLTPENHVVAVELARLPEGVRGYEDVKLKNVETYDRDLARLKSAFARPAPSPRRYA